MANDSDSSHPCFVPEFNGNLPSTSLLHFDDCLWFLTKILYQVKEVLIDS